MRYAIARHDLKCLHLLDDHLSAPQPSPYGQYDTGDQQVQRIGRRPVLARPRPISDPTSSETTSHVGRTPPGRRMRRSAKNLRWTYSAGTTSFGEQREQCLSFLCLVSFFTGLVWMVSRTPGPRDYWTMDVLRDRTLREI